jgi:hypothetical protein
VPRRKRLTKRRDQLTLERDLLLLLGPNPRGPRPEPGSEEWEALHACWEQHRYTKRAAIATARTAGAISRLSSAT